MRIEQFELERWQSVWENQVELNLAESGVEPFHLRELFADPTELEQLLALPLGYPQTNGSEALRAHIATLYPGASAANVLVTCGCAEANYLVVWALVEPGDEVIFMQPNYMQIAGIARAFGAQVRPLWLREELGWKPDFDELRRLVTPKTRLLAICNPNNPTGAALNTTEREQIAAAAASVGAWILADEVYRGAELVGEMTPSFWGSYARVLVTAGLSKAYGLPGLRVGWIVAPPEWAEKLWGYHDYTSIGPTAVSDYLAALILEPARRTRVLARTRRLLTQNYPIIRDWISRQQGFLSHIPPAAGAIAWVRYQADWNSSEFAEALRRKKSVLVVPGDLFEMDSYLRLGYGGDTGKLRQALARVEEMFAEYPLSPPTVPSARKRA